MGKRELEFHGKNGRYLYYIGKHLIPYFENQDIEDLQIIKYGELRLIKRGGKEETVKDANFDEKYIKIIMNFFAAISPKRLQKEDSVISMMLPVNAFRFTGEIGHSIKSGVKISIRLNDIILGYNYKDFSLSELEFNFITKHICENGASSFIIGEVGSGKTTFNNLIIEKLAENEIINVVGDIHDFIFQKEQAVSEVFAKSEKDYRNKIDLLMRSNPKRILIPELTTSNVNFIMRIINSGIKGLLLTMHSSSDEYGVADAFVDNLKSAGAVADVDSIQSRLKKHIDFLIHLCKDKKGKRGIEKIVINNQKILEEAKELGILGFVNKNDRKLKKNKKNIKKRERKNISIINLSKDLKSGLSQRELAKKYKISRNTISKLLKNFK